MGPGHLGQCAAKRGAQVDWRVEEYEGLPSTQDVVKARAATGEAEGLVVRALWQEAGYGRRGRTWASPLGNLYASALLRPPALAATRAGELSLVAGAALALALPGARLKWPNDLLIGGRKCAGVLVETGLSGAVVAWAALGMGVNADAPPPGAGAVPGADLDAILEALAEVYALWQRAGLAPVRAAWLARCAHAPGQRITAAGHTGVFQGLDADGALLLSGRRVTT